MPRIQVNILEAVQFELSVAEEISVSERWLIIRADGGETKIDLWELEIHNITWYGREIWGYFELTEEIEHLIRRMCLAKQQELKAPPS
jgi:hypothetical protein